MMMMMDIRRSSSGLLFMLYLLTLKWN